MNLSELKKIGGFIDTAPVKVPVSWNGNDFDVHVRRLAFGDVERLMQAEGNPSIAMIAAAVMLGDELEPMTREDAERLDVTLAAELIKAINSINGVQSGN
jgi:hypothetical protein